jgi:hypothetical protein
MRPVAGYEVGELATFNTHSGPAPSSSAGSRANEPFLAIDMPCGPHMNQYPAAVSTASYVQQSLENRGVLGVGTSHRRCMGNGRSDGAPRGAGA